MMYFKTVHLRSAHRFNLRSASLQSHRVLLIYFFLSRLPEAITGVATKGMPPRKK